MNENKLKKDYHNINKNIIDKVANIIKEGDITDPKNKELIKEYLANTDYEYCNCIGEFVASIFGVDKCDILAKDKSIELVHARCLWWYALYFMLRKSYREISILVNLEDVTWNEKSICVSINRIQEELTNNIELQTKWDIIKKMIYIGEHKNAYDNPFSMSMGYKIRVYKPKGVKIEVIEE